MGVEVVNSISTVLPEILGNGISSDIAQIIHDKILTSASDDHNTTAEMRFQSEIGGGEAPKPQASNRMKIAVIDDDPVIQQILQSTFARINQS